MNIKKFENFSGDDLFIHSKISKNIDSIEELKSYLEEFNIPLEKYGKGTYKTINHLLNEIKEGETKLVEKDGKLERYVEFIGARIVYKDDNGDFWRLYETKQVFKDGRKRVRKTMPYSMAEKFKSGEDIKEGIIRGMEEELGIKVSKDQFAYYNTKIIREDGDYPGIKSFHKGHEFLVNLTDDQFKKEGYIERQADKDVYFGWKKMYDSDNLNENISIFNYGLFKYLDSSSSEQSC